MNAQRGSLCFLATFLLLALSLALPDLSAFAGSRNGITPVSLSGSGTHHASQTPPSSPFEGGLQELTERPLPLAVLQDTGFNFSPVCILQKPFSKDKRQNSKYRPCDSGDVLVCLHRLSISQRTVSYFISLSRHYRPDKRAATGNGPDDPRAGPLA